LSNGITKETGCIELHYNAQDQLTQYGTTRYTYTLNGELKTKTTLEGITVYDHDPMGNLVQVILPNNTVIGYTYDAKNRRIAKKVDGVITERLIYKDQLAPIAKLDGDGNVLEEYVYGIGINSPDYIKKDGVNYRVIKDHLGSTRMIMNSSTGEVVKTIRYSEFGEITEETGTFNTIFGFAGGIRDTDTELTKFGARWYDPETGRWIQRDPIMFDGGLNHYAYVSNDPVNKIDPTGLVLIEVTLPWLGRSYLDEEFVPVVMNFIHKLETKNINLIVTHAFRYRGQKLKGTVVNPAPRSSHHAGFAIDISWKSLNPSEQEIVKQVAKDVGLSWGGNFKNYEYDPVHFYSEPTTRTRIKTIKKNQRDYFDNYLYEEFLRSIEKILDDWYRQ